MHLSQKQDFSNGGSHCVKVRVHVHVQLATNKITNVLQNAKMPRRNVNYFKINKVIKVTMKQIFLLSYSKKGFQNIKEWHLFYCDSTLGCRELTIRDFDLCKLDYL